MYIYIANILAFAPKPAWKPPPKGHPSLEVF